VVRWQTRSSSLLLVLHPDLPALAAFPFSLLVVDVPLKFLHRNFAGLAGHVNAFILNDPLATSQTVGAALAVILLQCVLHHVIPNYFSTLHHKSHSLKFRNVG
jgi:hypothetical protein